MQQLCYPRLTELTLCQRLDLDESTAFRCFLTSAYRPVGKHLIQTPFSSLQSDQLYHLVQNYSCNCRKEENWLSKWKAENKTWQICCWCGWILYGTLAYVARKHIVHCYFFLLCMRYVLQKWREVFWSDDPKILNFVRCSPKYTHEPFANALSINQSINQFICPFLTYNI